MPFRLNNPPGDESATCVRGRGLSYGFRSVSIEATLREDGRYCLGFCFIKLGVLKVTLRKNILQGSEIDSKIGE